MTAGSDRLPRHRRPRVRCGAFPPDAVTGPPAGSPGGRSAVRCGRVPPSAPVAPVAVGAGTAPAWYRFLEDAGPVDRPCARTDATTLFTDLRRTAENAAVAARESHAPSRG